MPLLFTFVATVATTPPMLSVHVVANGLEFVIVTVPVLVTDTADVLVVESINGVAPIDSSKAVFVIAVNGLVGGVKAPV